MENAFNMPPYFYQHATAVDLSPFNFQHFPWINARCVCAALHFAKSLSLFAAIGSAEIFLAISLLVRHPSLFHPFHIFHYSLLRSKQRTSHHTSVASWLAACAGAAAVTGWQSGFVQEMKQNANKFAWLGLLWSLWPYDSKKQQTFHINEKNQRSSSFLLLQQRFVWRFDKELSEYFAINLVFYASAYSWNREVYYLF